MPRSIWNGALRFGLTVVPVKVHSATEDHSIHFHQVHAKDGVQIKQKRICSKEGKEVPYKQVAKGYEVRKGTYVLLTQEEIDAAAGDGAHLVELDEFVCAAEIDPVYYQRTYFLGAGDDGRDAYRLLHDALQRTDRVGLGGWVFHNREYLVAVRSLDGVLALHTMNFHDELVDPGSVEVGRPSKAPTKREVEMAGKLVESLHAHFKPDEFEDSYRQRVLDLIEAKARGEEPDVTEPPQETESADLASALEASLQGR
jgi:DNA end-binding protein Ku